MSKTFTSDNLFIKEQEEDKTGEYAFEEATSMVSRPRSAAMPTPELGGAAFGEPSEETEEELPAFGSSTGFNSGGLFGTLSEGVTLKAYNETRRRQLQALRGAPIIESNTIKVKDEAPLVLLALPGKEENEPSHSTQALVEHSVIREIKTSGISDNLDVSLFWEEKALIAIRYAQLYGYLLLCYYEAWPFDVRDQWAHLFFFLTGTLHFMVGQD